MKIPFEHVKYGDVFGIRYHFQNVGDGLPPHMHHRETAHVVVVLRGRVRFRIQSENPALPTPWVGKTLIAGDIWEFDWSKPHEIIAADPESEILNLFLYGQPPGYEDLPDHEKSGVIDLD